MAVKCEKCGQVVFETRNRLCRACDPELDASIRYREEWERKQRARKRALSFALRSRVLTIEEMEQVEKYDYMLFVDGSYSYNTADVQKTFNEALLQQFKIRLAAEVAQKQMEAK